MSWKQWTGRLKKTRSHPEMVGDMSRVTARPVYIISTGLY